MVVGYLLTSRPKAHKLAFLGSHISIVVRFAISYGESILQEIKALKQFCWRTWVRQFCFILGNEDQWKP